MRISQKYNIIENEKQRKNKNILILYNNIKNNGNTKI